jgi:hypothetical protein
VCPAIVSIFFDHVCPSISQTLRIEFPEKMSVSVGVSVDPPYLVHADDLIEFLDVSEVESFEDLIMCLDVLEVRNNHDAWRKENGSAIDYVSFCV